MLEKARQDWASNACMKRTISVGAECHHRPAQGQLLATTGRESEASLPELARRDYGTEAARHYQGLAALDDAMEFYVASNEISILRRLPAYPFIFQPNITRTMGQKEIAPVSAVCAFWRPHRQDLVSAV